MRNVFVRPEKHFCKYNPNPTCHIVGILWGERSCSNGQTSDKNRKLLLLKLLLNNGSVDFALAAVLSELDIISSWKEKQAALEAFLPSQLTRILVNIMAHHEAMTCKGCICHAVSSSCFATCLCFFYMFILFHFWVKDWREELWRMHPEHSLVPIDVCTCWEQFNSQPHFLGVSVQLREIPFSRILVGVTFWHGI